MANIKFTGIDEYVEALQNLYGDVDKNIEAAVNAGADVVADTVRVEINSIPEDNRNFVPRGQMRTGLKRIQINGLKSSFGITPLRNDSGFINRKVGFDGYNKIGQPNSYIARTIEKGTSWLRKYSFMSKAQRASKALCEVKLRETLEASIYDSFQTKL